MDRKSINQIINIPLSTLSEWSKKDDKNWRKRLYIILTNIDKDDVEKLLKIGDLKKLSMDDIEKNVDLYIDVKDKEEW